MGNYLRLYYGQLMILQSALKLLENSDFFEFHDLLLSFLFVSRGGSSRGGDGSTRAD